MREYQSEARRQSRSHWVENCGLCDRNLQDTRERLVKWGKWAHRQEKRFLGYSSIGPGQKLIDLARLGCRIQQSMRMDHSENLRVPQEHAQIEAAIETLTHGERAALTAFYVRNQKLPRHRVRRIRILLQAEQAVMHAL